jgi:hypothetical protein
VRNAVCVAMGDGGSGKKKKRAMACEGAVAVAVEGQRLHGPQRRCNGPGRDG